MKINLYEQNNSPKSVFQDLVELRKAENLK